MPQLIAQVRDANLTRVGILSDHDLVGLKLFPARNDVGTWTLTLPHMVRAESGEWVRHHMAEELAKPGAGIIVELPGGRRFSGPVLSPKFTESTEDVLGTWEFTGVSDAIILADRLAFPDPTVADAQASSLSKAQDTRTGVAESLLYQYVSANIGPTASTGRRDTRLTLGTNFARGTSRTKSARFDNLLTLCQELAVTDGLLFDVVQVGTSLRFQTSTPADLTASVRMDVHGDTLASASYSYSGQTASKVIVLGKGENRDRIIRTRTAPATAWPRVIEVAVDARGAASTAELDAKGDEVLAQAGIPATSLDVTPSDVNARELGIAWWLGDKVTVNVAGQPVKATVTRIRIEVTPDGIHAGATVGDAVGFDPTRVTTSRVEAVESRVASLELSAESAVPMVHNGGIIAHSLNPPDFPLGITVGESDAGFPPGAYGTVEVVKFNSGRALQRVTNKGDTVTRTWQRSSAGTGAQWGPWAIEGRSIPLAAANLDSITTNGNYVQPTSAEATLSRNYPIARAGFLEVFTNDSGSNVGIMQRYTDFRGLGDSSSMGMWVRTWYNTWGPWVRLDVGRDTGWVSLSSYFLDASVEGRRIGDNVVIRGATGTDIPTGTGVVTITSTNLPAEWRPTGQAAYGTAYSGGMALAVVLGTSGTMQVSSRNAVAITGSVPFTIPFMAG